MFGSRKSIASILIGLLAFIAYLWFFVGFDGLFKLLEHVNQTQYWLHYVAAIGALLLSILFDSMSWHNLLKALAVKIKLTKVVLFNWIGNFVEMIVPGATIGGEVTRIYLTQKESKEDLGTTAASVLSARMLNASVLLVGMVAGSFTLIVTGQMPGYLTTTLVLTLAGSTLLITAILVLAVKEGSSQKFISLIFRLAGKVYKNKAKLSQLGKKLDDSLLAFGAAFKEYKKSPHKLVKPIFFAILSWFFTLFVYLMVFYSLDYTAISIADLAVIYTIATTVETLSAGVPVGVVEITLISLFTLYGVPTLIGGAATTLTRVLTFWCQILVGYPIVQWTAAKHLRTDQDVLQKR